MCVVYVCANVCMCACVLCVCVCVPCVLRACLLQSADHGVRLRRDVCQLLRQRTAQPRALSGVFCVSLIYICIYAYIHACIRAYIHAYIDTTYMHAYIQSYMHTCIYRTLPPSLSLAVSAHLGLGRRLCQRRNHRLFACRSQSSCCTDTRLSWSCACG
jgi:hypothetical protein